MPLYEYLESMVMVSLRRSPQPQHSLHHGHGPSTTGLVLPADGPAAVLLVCQPQARQQARNCHRLGTPPIS